MKQIISVVIGLLVAVTVYGQVDMQAHVASDEGRNAYTSYQRKQQAYYVNGCSEAQLHAMTGDALYGALNALMGRTCMLEEGNYSYNSLRFAYVGVDRDLNRAGYIIGYYDGYSFDGTWDSGATWNREHTWPQSKGANKDISMGHDMQSVRPTRVAVNSDRGNKAYGESSGYYNPDVEPINNPLYKQVNMGTYKGDAARVILYDYLVYGQVGEYSNDLYNGNAQLLSKLGPSGVFESLDILLKWHTQDPPSLTEMVRNDGAQDYQGNRNPFIDYPELALEIFRNEITLYAVDVDAMLQMAPAYQHTTSNGFVAYLTLADGTHPSEENVEVVGTSRYTYDAAMGRLTITQTNADVQVRLREDVGQGMETVGASHRAAPIYDVLGRIVKRLCHGQMYICNGEKFVY